MLHPGFLLGEGLINTLLLLFLFLGNASRLCDVTANWANPDLSGCVSPAFAELNNKVCSQSFKKIIIKIIIKLLKHNISAY